MLENTCPTLIFIFNAIKQKLCFINNDSYYESLLDENDSPHTRNATTQTFPINPNPYNPYTLPTASINKIDDFIAADMLKSPIQ